MALWHSASSPLPCPSVSVPASCPCLHPSHYTALYLSGRRGLAGAWLLTQTIDVPSVDSLSALSARVRRHCCCQHRRPITAAWSIGTTTVFVLPGYWSALALVRSGAGLLWRWSILALVRSRARQPFSGGVVFYSHFGLFFIVSPVCAHTPLFSCLDFFCTWSPRVRHFSGGMVLLPSVSINTLR